MTNSEKATPRPWIIDTDGMASIEDAQYTGDYWIAIGPTDKEGFSEVAAFAHPKKAELIVRAVNSHDALLEACKKTLLWMGNDFPGHTKRTCDQVLREAIEKAEGVKP